MFGIITCSDCRRKRIIDLSDDVTVCPYCKHRTVTKNAAVIYKNEDQGTVRAMFSSLTGFVPEEKQKTEDKDPMSTLAFETEHISDIGLKINAICDGLSEIKGTFTLEDVEEIAPGKGEKYLKIMLEECMVYEVSLGRYKK